MDFEDVDDTDEAQRWAVTHMVANRSFANRAHERFRYTSERRWSLKPI
ncbi:hypothetical protein [Streptomyces sp. HC307]